MHQLLDFICDFSTDDQVYLTAHTTSGRRLELFWRRDDRHRWRVVSTDGAVDLRLPREQVLPELSGLGVEMGPLGQALSSLAASQIAHADAVLHAARRYLGSQHLQQSVASHRDFLGQISEAVRDVTDVTDMNEGPPALRVVDGGGRTTGTRRDHLTLT